MKKTILLLLTAVVFVIANNRTAQAQNMLTNPGFEDWTVNGAGGPPDDWSLSGTSMTAEQEATTIHGGTYSAKITWTTTSTRYLQQIDIPITAGNSYEFSFWVYDNDPGGRARIYLRWWDATGSQVYPAVADPYSVDMAEWQLLSSGSVQAPALAVEASAEIRVYDVSGWPGTATVYVDDAVFEDLSGLPPVIVNAYSISSDAMDVVYDKNITTVDPGDYYLTGTAYTVFSSATIDGSDAKIVHLSGANPPMVGDITLDNIADDGNGTDFDFYAGIMPIYYTNTNNPTGTMSDGYTATFHGIVSANDDNNSVWVSDAAGQYNGILIYNYSFYGEVAVGDEILFYAERSPYNNLSELVNPGLITKITTGNTPYGPSVINGSDIEYTIGADTDPAEPWEGQLVKIENFTVDSAGTYSYWGSWSDSKATYVFNIGDNVDYHLNNITLSVGATYPSITGVIDWNYSGPYYRINPRNQLDIEGSSNPATQLAVISVNGGVHPYENVDFEVIVQAQDAAGDPAFVTSNVNFTFTTNGGDLGTVGFVGGTTTTGIIAAGTGEVTVTGVQMAPTGTNVTITANDDNLFGLASGTSDPFNVIEFSVPDIIITEIMQNPAAVSDTYGEWFEVFNNTGSAVDMDGWTIKDDGTDSHIISGTLIVPSYGFAVLGRDADPATNGGYTCDYEYTGFTLGNSDDEVVLLLPDGVTEVDRVEYDGGPVWPDPTGTSMTFTGFPSEDNNDGTKWTYATFRESTYTGDTGDRGSPGSNGYDQIMTGGFKLDLKVFLEGPYNTVNDSMGNDLRSDGLLPFYQPFDPALPYYGNNNPVWQYSGIDTITYIPYYAVDWVLIELRDASSAAGAGSGTMIAQYPAYLMADGKVVSLNGSTPLNVNLTISNNLFIVIWHRNHLGIMNATGLNPVDGTVETYDFSTGSGQVYGGAAGYIELETNVWGMVAGDVNADGTINADDKGNGWSTDAGASGYLGGDLNLNTQSNNQDKNDLWLPNEGTSSQVPN
ncbi:MAG: lamin tail domain-containing protein [Bacteroidetes bacterium]|nr:lamin tail domain-containing protein [Bacteroidota bacterium]MBL7104138.1 lamin tail domain-containing protein [Bacteroidales bacterium]